MKVPKAVQYFERSVDEDLALLAVARHCTQLVFPLLKAAGEKMIIEGCAVYNCICKYICGAYLYL